MDQEYQLSKRLAFDALPMASPWERTLSFLIDVTFAWALVTLAQVAFKISLSPFDQVRYGLCIHLFFEVVGLSFWGKSLGKALLKLQVYSPKQESHPDIQQVLIRTLTFWGQFLFFNAGSTPVIFRKDRRGWHDSISETVVIGQIKSVPKNDSSNIARFAFRFQVVCAVSYTLAVMASGSNPLKGWQSEAQAKSSISCDDPAILLENHKEVLLAMIISPSWAKCWDETGFSLSLLQDSKVLEGVKTARLVHVASTTSLTSRQIASFTENSKLMDVVTLLDENYAALAKKILGSSSKADRLKVLRAELENHDHHEIVKRSLQDRIWAETLALHQFPYDVKAESFYPEWNSDQVCWLEALNLIETHECQNQEIKEIAEKLKIIDAANTLTDEAEAAIRYLESKKASDQKAIAQMARLRFEKSEQLKAKYFEFSEISPLYHWAQNWATKI